MWTFEGWLHRKAVVWSVLNNASCLCTNLCFSSFFIITALHLLELKETVGWGISDLVNSVKNYFSLIWWDTSFFLLELMLTVVLGNSKLSFAVTDCISQGSLAENSIHSRWFKQREIYYRVLNGLQNLLGRWRNILQVELPGVPSRASRQSRPPREQ